ncbi:MAG: response regulator transcription factor [Sphingomonadaceae bacterium]
MRKQTVLVVDDEPRILRFVRAELEAAGFRVLTAPDGFSAQGMLETETPDLVVLDVIMPGLDGFQLLQRIRERSSVPVILLTARGSDADKVRGLDLGADDYLTKPFSPDELSARVRAVLRRTAAASGAKASRARFTVAGLVVDFERRKVVVDGKEVQMSRTEWQLLQQLALNAGKVMLHEDLLVRTWGPEYRDDVEYLRVWVSRLRRKIEEDPSRPRFLRTVPGVGYVLADEEDVSTA